MSTGGGGGGGGQNRVEIGTICCCCFGAFIVGKERNVLFNDALNTFYLRLYGVKFIVGFIIIIFFVDFFFLKFGCLYYIIPKFRKHNPQKKKIIII